MEFPFNIHVVTNMTSTVCTSARSQAFFRQFHRNLLRSPLKVLPVFGQPLTLHLRSLVHFFKGALGPIGHNTIREEYGQSLNPEGQSVSGSDFNARILYSFFQTTIFKSEGVYQPPLKIPMCCVHDDVLYIYMHDVYKCRNSLSFLQKGACTGTCGECHSI